MKLRIRILHVLVLVLLLSFMTSCGQGTKTESAQSALTGAAIAGSISDPTPLVPDVLYSSYAPGSGYSYYTFTTTTAGAYLINLTNTGFWALSIDLEMFTDAGYTIQKGACSTDFNWQCAVSNMEPNTIYYVRVSAFSPIMDNPFTVMFTHGLGEGSVGDPMPLVSGVTHTGGVDILGTSYYSLSLSEAGTYAVSIAGMPGSVYWQLYADQFVTPLASCNLASGYPDLPGDIVCEAPNLAAGTYYLKVQGNWIDNNTYGLTAFRDDAGGYAGGPAPLAFETPYTSTVYANGIDYFTVPLTTSGAFRVLITNTALDLFWELYDANSTFIMRCDSLPNYPGCVTPNLDRGTYTVRVYTRDLAAGQYDITATGTGGSEGSIHQPIPVYPRTLHTGGKVAKDIAHSYYVFTTENLPYDVPYIISVRGLDSNDVFTNTRWALFSDPGFGYDSLVGSECGSIWNRNMVCVTNSYQTTITLSSNTTYYLVVYNSSTSSTAQTYSLMASPFDSRVGCSQGGQCYSFENGVPAGISSPDIPWKLDPANAGTGSYGFTSGITKRNETSSCFDFSATDAAWISYSSRSNFTSAYETLEIYIDGQSYVSLFGAHPWMRTYLQTLPPGTHQYRFCHQINRNIYKGPFNPVSLDDIELIY